MAAPIQVQLYSAAAVVSQAGQCCEAAVAIAGQRFLMAEVPMLPLEGCSRVDACSCRYQKFSDRRQDERREVGARFGTLDREEQRTKKRGRREDD